MRELDVSALAAALLSGALGFLSSKALNADGVSYLDLAGAARDGDWATFVQGYWSPLYPLLLAGTGAMTGADGRTVLAIAHLLNVIIAFAGIAVIWTGLRRLENPLPGRLAISAWLLCAVRPPRVDALTPDLLLTVLILALALELTGAARPVRIGGLLGGIFLAKTSTWPWIILVLGLEAWRTRGAFAPLLKTASTCAAIMLLWIVPLSVKSGAPTIEASGSLNVCWYLKACDSRTPDTHAGEHANYREASVEGRQLEWATFDSARWTYAPWSDPTTWAAGVRTDSGHLPSVASLLSYWARLAGAALRYWLWPVILSVLLPAFLARRQKGAAGFTERDRPAIAVTVAGALGVCQFFLIHAEPRLIGPYLMCLGIGVVFLCVPPSSDAIPEPKSRKGARPGPGGRGWLVLSYAGYAIALVFAVASLRDAFLLRAKQANRERAVEAALVPLRQAGIARPRVAIIGYALPVLADAWRANLRVAAQLRPASARQLATLPPEGQQRLAAIAFAPVADVLWFADADASILVSLPTPAAPRVPVGR